MSINSTPRRPKRRGVIEHDRACPNCDYNLRGLTWGGVCPECGEEIASDHGPDAITLAPVEFLRTLRGACYALVISAIAGLVLLLPAWCSVIFLGAAVAPAVAWWVSVWVATRPLVPTRATMRPRQSEARMSRAAARITQAAWVPMCIAAIGVVQNSAIPGFAPSIFTWAALAWTACFITGIIGLVPLCHVLSDIAHWGMETTLGHQLRMVAMSLAVLGSMLALAFLALLMTQVTLTFTFITGLAGFVFFIFSSVFLLGVVYFMVLLIQLANMVRWAIINAAGEEVRGQRLVERVARARARARVAPPPPPMQDYVHDDAPIPLAEPDAPPPRPYDSPA